MLFLFLCHAIALYRLQLRLLVFADHILCSRKVDRMSTFDTAEMKNALPEASTPKNRMNAEAAAVAREKGWVPPQEYDYAKYTYPDPSKDPAEGQGNSENPEWASNAAKYEWREEYGDIGPRNVELECMLFHNEFINRAGIKFEA